MNSFHRFFKTPSALALSLAVLFPAAGRAVIVTTPIKTMPAGALAPLGLPTLNLTPAAFGSYPTVIAAARPLTLQSALLTKVATPRIAPTQIAADAKAQPHALAKDNMAALANIVSAPEASTVEKIQAVYDGSSQKDEPYSVMFPQESKPIAFDFSSLDPTDRYFFAMRPTRIRTHSNGQVIEMAFSLKGGEDSYIARYENGKNVEILKDGLTAPIQLSALRGLQEMLTYRLERNQIRNPLYARMLDEIRATLSPAYVPGTPDLLWRYLWNFRYRDIDPTVAYYANYRTDAVASPRRGEIELVVRSNADKLILTWNPRSGFSLKQGDGRVFSPDSDALSGLQLSLMKEMLETGSRGQSALKLLQKLQNAVNAS